MNNFKKTVIFSKHLVNHRGVPPVEDDFVSTELSPVKEVNSVLTIFKGSWFV